jgi:hypothetical protein
MITSATLLWGGGSSSGLTLRLITEIRYSAASTAQQHLLVATILGSEDRMPRTSVQCSRPGAAVSSAAACMLWGVSSLGCRSTGICEVFWGFWFTPAAALDLFLQFLQSVYVGHTFFLSPVAGTALVCMIDVIGQ